MAPNNWRQWAKLTKKQLRQLGRVIDVELGSVLERHFPRQIGRLARVPVPIRNAPPKFRTSTISNRSYHHSTKLAADCANQFVKSRLSQGSTFANNINNRVTMFSSGSKVPRGMPRGLFTNWNLCARNAGQRMYSTASIKFTHEAVNNMAISLRCFFNSLDGLVLPQNSDQLRPRLSEIPKGQLLQRDICLIRDMQMFEMIQYHKEEAQLCDGEESLGSYVEFRVPSFGMKKAMPSMAFANSVALDVLREEIIQYTSELKDLERSVRRIYESYGSLPMTSAGNYVRVHFPTSTMQETEKLITELGITVGCVYPDSLGLESDVLSNLDDDMSCGFSSVLSRSPSIVGDNYAFV